MPTETFPQKPADRPLSAVPIRALGLTIAGSELEPVLTEFARELERVGLRRLRPVFYLSTDWGVPDGTVAIGIPFYLARPELTRLHAERVGHVEGVGRADILRYLRHEMGHVVNYAYRLYERPEWTQLFGRFELPYVEDYRPEPWSRRFVRHLPGWYAQKHPDEDWAETFAVWMTPGQDWRADYADWPGALAKLEYCDRVLAEVKDREPLVTAADLDEDVGELAWSLDDYYGSFPEAAETYWSGLDGALRSVFEDLGHPEGDSPAARVPAAALIRGLERQLMADVYRWSGHFPERTRPLLRHLARRAEQLEQVYPQDREVEAAVAVTVLVTALAMNHVHHGSYLPGDSPAPQPGPI
jgi:hypothetical protein